MTTIIVVVIVALVFFVTLCVATFMVWKREEEMRTDSLRAIEANLQELGYRMTDDFTRNRRKSVSYTPTIEPLPVNGPATRSADPFDWTREDIQPEPAEVDDAALYQSIVASGAVEEPHEEEHQQYPEDAPQVQVNEADEEYDVWEDIDDDVMLMTGAPDAPYFAGAPDDAGAHEEIEPLNEEAMPDQPTDDYLDISSLEQLMNDDFEIDFDKIKVPELMGEYIADYSAEDVPKPREPIGRDIGRSGRRYTAEELDMLIKE